MGKCVALAWLGLTRTQYHTVYTLRCQLTQAKRKAIEKTDFFKGFCDIVGDLAVQWSEESTDPILVNGEWMSVYKPKISNRMSILVYR